METRKTTQPQGALADEVGRVLALLRRHGWNATSFQILEPGFRYWFDGDRGCVAYVDTGGAWVAAGAPIAEDASLPKLSRRFIEDARRARRRAVFFAVEERFVEAVGLPSLPVGEQPVWDPSRWDETLRSSKSLREQIRRSKAKQVRVRQVSAEEIAGAQQGVRVEVERLIARWVASRQMAQMGFLVELHPFSYPDERRYFVAEQQGRVVGFLSVVPVYERGGWFLEDLLRDPTAPNGTAELLVDAAMRQLGAEGCSYATLGLAPLAGELAAPLRLARWLGARLYDFEGLRAFKARLRPQRWDGILVAWPEGQGGAALAVFETLRAFARGGLLRFGVQTIVRVPPFVLQVLGLLLVPWTIAMVTTNTARWFPSPWVKLAWVLLDLGLVVALLRLGARWQRRAATALSIIVTADAVLTLAQAAAFNLPRVQDLWEALALIIAVTAPWLAAAALWRARALRMQAAQP